MVIDNYEIANLKYSMQFVTGIREHRNFISKKIIKKLQMEYPSKTFKFTPVRFIIQY